MFILKRKMDSLEKTKVFNEAKLSEIAKPYFEFAREGDWAHAQRVVKWVKELGIGRKDLYLLVTAAYIHDIGWSGVAPKGKVKSLEEMLKLEPLANSNSKRLVLEVLTKMQFSADEMATVNRFVAAADKHKSGQEDEEIIVDADQLSKLCIEHLQDKYEESEFNKFIAMWKSEFPSRMKTQKGKDLYPELLLELEKAISKSNG